MYKDQPSFEEYLKLASSFPHLQMHQEGFEALKRLYNKKYPNAVYTPVYYILNYAQLNYHYIDETCYEVFGYPAQQWKAEGVEGYLKKWHRNDYQIMNHKVFPENIRFLQLVELEQYTSLVFSFNYRVLNAKGEYITVLQRSSYIPSTTPGKPLGSIGFAIDISHFKNDTSMVHTIEEITVKHNHIAHTLLYKKIYSEETSPTPIDISQREIQVLKQIAEGLSSKQIAQNLHLSINTVNNHRKNMLNKTGCKSSSELLNYALKHGYL